MKDLNLKIIFADILNGYTLYSSPIIIGDKGFSEVVIKHTDNFDSARINFTYDDFYKKAISSNIPAEKDRIEELIKEKLWSAEKDKAIYEIDLYIKNLYDTITKLHQKWDIDPVKAEILKQETELIKLKSEKELLISNTAEKFASKKINDLHIFSCLFTDTSFKNSLFSKGEFDELDDSEVNKLLVVYNIALESFNENNIKKIALSNFFTNYFYLCNDDPQVFFGKAVMNLTFFQVELFGFARYYKNIISNSKNPPPDDISGDPEKLVEWYNIEKNKEKYEDTSGDNIVSMDKIKQTLIKKGNLDHQDILNL